MRQPSADPATARIVLFADDGARADGQRLAAALGRGRWDYAVLASLSPGELSSHQPSPQLLVVMGAGAALSASVSAVAEALPALPILGIGPHPLPGASCWLRAQPSTDLFDLLLRELLAAAASASGTPPLDPSVQMGRWRRKGDMIIGHSRATEQLLKTLDRLAPSGAPVLVTGESGTGKELVARALHYGSPRVSGPFVALNCAAIPESLVEAELFGHERGAFTGAVAQRPGAFESAHNGTLFLDEIGEMPVIHQAKLLRVLETSEVARVGSSAVHKVNVRLVAATNRDLETEIRAGRFRQDLYYRLMVYPVQLSPLRERPEDVLPIVDHHLAMIAAREKRHPHRLAPSAVEKLLAHRWPGNVRELLNVLERACLVAPGNVLEGEHLVLSATAPLAATAHPDPLPGSAPSPVLSPVLSPPLDPPSGPSALTSYRDAKARFEAEYYRQLLHTAGGNISLAAKLADKTRKEIYDALKRVGVDPTEYRSDAHR